MDGKQIVGILLLITGFIVLIIGGIKINQLIDLSTNPYVNVLLHMGGTSLSALWIKYSGVTVVGIVMVIVGINFAKKQIVKVEM